jgi:hypothetical protein
MVRWDSLGHGVDYRIRAAFTVPTVPAAVVLGMRGGPGEVRPLGEDLTEAYLDLLSDEPAHVRGRPWLLTPASEGRLGAMCLAMSWFERFYREGPAEIRSPLVEDDVPRDLTDLLARVPAYAIRDLEVQTRLAAENLGTLRSGTDPEECRGGPTFEGSEDVGGADADLVVGDLLLEIKATSRPARIRPEVLWQLAGYCLLDYDDDLRLDRAGLYLSRIGWLRSWPLDDFLRQMGARTSLAGLRGRLASQVRDRLECPVQEEGEL